MEYDEVSPGKTKIIKEEYSFMDKSIYWVLNEKTLASTYGNFPLCEAGSQANPKTIGMVFVIKDSYIPWK